MPNRYFATPAKLKPSGEWGARVDLSNAQNPDAVPAPGDLLMIHTKAGKEWSSIVGKVVWSGLAASEHVHLVTTTTPGGSAKKSAPSKRRSKKKPAAAAAPAPAPEPAPVSTDEARAVAEAFAGTPKPAHKACVACADPANFYAAAGLPCPECGAQEVK